MWLLLAQQLEAGSARVHLPCGGAAAGGRSLGVDTARAGIESLEGQDRGRRGSGGPGYPRRRGQLGLARFSPPRPLSVSFSQTLTLILFLG
jgi:hypothetical protein